MAITETYVDPAIAGDSGAGTSGDPYGDLQHALDTMTRDGTNGDRINIKAGTDEVLTAAIDLSTYGTPDVNAPLVFQGYTSAAGDGGIGGISGNGSYSIFTTTTIENMSFIDLHCHNSGSNPVLNLDRHIIVLNCEIDNTTGDGIYFNAAGGALVENCYIHNIGDSGVHFQAGGFVNSCYFQNGTNDFTYGIQVISSNATITNCIFDLDGSSTAMFITPFNAATFISNNTIYSSSGTGTGIDIDSSSDSVQWIANNYIEGFSGVGGIGIDTGANDGLHLLNNKYYNNATHRVDGDIITDSGNGTVASSALTNPGAGDFSVGTDLKAGAYPTTFKGVATDQFLDIGAAQREEPAGGGGTTGRQGLHSIEAGAV